MRSLTGFVLFTAALTSCARMPYEQWSGRLNSMETELADQKKMADQISSPDIFLFEGVYGVTKDGEAKPYPELKKISSTIKNSNLRISIESDKVIKHSEELKEMYFQRSLRTMGPEWENYQTIFQELKDQKKTNSNIVSSLEEKDVVFDSLCNAHKIKAIPIGESEAKLLGEIDVLKERFQSLDIAYKQLKKEITKRENQKESLTSLNRMRLKIRQVEGEFFQLSNLYSRIETLRADVMIFEGPGVESMDELRLIKQNSRKITGLLNELESTVKSY